MRLQEFGYKIILVISSLTQRLLPNPKVLSSQRKGLGVLKFPQSETFCCRQKLQLEHSQASKAVLTASNH